MSGSNSVIIISLSVLPNLTTHHLITHRNDCRRTALAERSVPSEVDGVLSRLENSRAEKCIRYDEVL